MRTYNVFISHSWSHSDHYDRLVGLLDKRPYFRFKDYSVPKDHPIHNAPNAAKLTMAIARQIRPCGIILVAAGVYTTYRKWMLKEMRLAKMGGKPILGIKPYGNDYISKEVRKFADDIVGWNSGSIVAAIKDLSG